MMRKILILAALMPLFFFTGCKGGGGESTTDSTVTEQLQTAKTTLASGDIASARDAYTAIIDAAAAMTVSKSPTETETSEARFGRALCDIILQIENTPFTAILAGFGQPAWSTSSLFGPSGYLYLSTTVTNPDKSALPFNNVKDCFKVYHHSRGRCAMSRVTSGYTAQSIASSLNELMTYVDSIIDDLSVAIETSSASFTIPKELYTGDADIPINHADMVQLLAGMYMLKAGSDFANSWTFNMDLSGLVNAEGNGLLTKAQLVDALNAQFALRSDNRLSSARTNLQTAITYSVNALDEILSGSVGGTLNLTSDNQIIYTDLRSLVNSAKSSFNSRTALEQVLPVVEVNLNDFFNNPADGSRIASDPFVLNGSKIEAVETYWQQMISTACNYTIGTHITLLSAAARAIDRPYYKLLNVIMGHNFGKYQAGT